MDFQNRMHAGKIGRTKFLVPELQSNLEHLGEMRNWFDELMAVNQVADQWSETTQSKEKKSRALVVRVPGSEGKQSGVPESLKFGFMILIQQIHSFHYVRIHSIGLTFRFHTPSARFPLLSSCQFGI